MKLNKYIHAYMNHNRLHVIHELANYYFNRNNDSIITYDRLHVIHEIVIFYFNKNEEFTQYKYVIIEFYVNNVGHIGINTFCLYVGNYLESNNFMLQNEVQDYAIFKIRYILN